MASELETIPPADDTIVLEAEGAARADDDWPVTDLYRVEPGDDAVAEPDEGARTVAASPAPEVLPPGQRRFPPDLGSRALLAVALAAGAILVAAVLLDLRSSEDTATAARESVGEPPIEAPSAPPPATAAPTTTTAQTTPTASANAPELPALEGMRLADARAALEKLGLEARVLRVASGEPRNQVVRQTPEAGTVLERGEAVALFASRGAQVPQEASLVEIPEVVGLAASDATQELRDAELTTRIRVVESSQRAGVVVRQSPKAGTDIEEGAAVRIDVARNRPAVPATVEVPDVRGASVADARSRLRSAGFIVRVSRTRSAEPEGTVLRQSPRAGAGLRERSTVTLTVSSGPSLVDVPDVTGIEAEAARLELEAAGFQVRTIFEPTSDHTQDGIVVRQTPYGGSTAEENAVVTLVVGRLV
jgi:beta-lactam-binding protein with PASTA domain